MRDCMSFDNFGIIRMQCYTENENEFQRLIMDGANINATDQNGDSPLLLAIKRGINLVVEFKIKNSPSHGYNRPSYYIVF